MAPSSTVHDLCLGSRGKAPLRSNQLRHTIRAKDNHSVVGGSKGVMLYAATTEGDVSSRTFMVFAPL